MITYYLAGLVSGVAIASFFIGKELYRYYVKSKVQEKKMSRLLKLNDKINKSFKIDATELSK
jgi:predicted metal-dependent RNase